MSAATLDDNMSQAITYAGNLIRASLLSDPVEQRLSEETGKQQPPRSGVGPPLVVEVLRVLAEREPVVTIRIYVS